MQVLILVCIYWLYKAQEDEKLSAQIDLEHDFI